jgi:hypothetical protein
MEASKIESGVTIQFLVGGLDIQFAGIFHLEHAIFGPRHTVTP